MKHELSGSLLNLFHRNVECSCLFVVDAGDTVDTASEMVAAAATSDAAALSVVSDAGAMSVSPSLVSTATIVTTSPPVSAVVSDLSATLMSTTETDTSVGEETVSAVPPDTAAALVVTTATAGSPQSGASSISSPEQSAADGLDEHAADAATTIPLVREPGASGTTLHIKPAVAVAESAADSLLTAIRPADTDATAADSVDEVSVTATENGGDVGETAEPATSSSAVAASATSNNLTSSGLTTTNDASTEPLSDEVGV